VDIKKDLSTQIRKITYKVFNHSKNIKFFDQSKDKYENIQYCLENKIDFLVKDFDIMDIKNCYDFDLLYLQISDIMY